MALDAFPPWKLLLLVIVFIHVGAENQERVTFLTPHTLCAQDVNKLVDSSSCDGSIVPQVKNLDSEVCSSPSVVILGPYQHPCDPTLGDHACAVLRGLATDFCSSPSGFISASHEDKLILPTKLCNFEKKCSESHKTKSNCGSFIFDPEPQETENWRTEEYKNHGKDLTQRKTVGNCGRSKYRSEITSCGSYPKSKYSYSNKPESETYIYNKNNDGNFRYNDHKIIPHAYGGQLPYIEHVIYTAPNGDFHSNTNSQNGFYMVDKFKIDDFEIHKNIGVDLDNKNQFRVTDNVSVTKSGAGINNNGKLFKSVGYSKEQDDNFPKSVFGDVGGYPEIKNYPKSDSAFTPLYNDYQHRQFYSDRYPEAEEYEPDITSTKGLVPVSETLNTDSQKFRDYGDDDSGAGHSQPDGTNENYSSHSKNYYQYYDGSQYQPGTSYDKIGSHVSSTRYGDRSSGIANESDFEGESSKSNYQDRKGYNEGNSDNGGTRSESGHSKGAYQSNRPNYGEGHLAKGDLTRENNVGGGTSKSNYYNSESYDNEQPVSRVITSGLEDGPLINDKQDSPYFDAEHSDNREMTSGIIYGSESPNSNYQSSPNYDSEYTVDNGGNTDESGYSKGIYNGGQSYGDAHSGNGEITSGIIYGSESPNNNYQSSPNYDSEYTVDSGGKTDESGHSKGIYNGGQSYGDAHSGNGEITSGIIYGSESPNSNYQSSPNYDSEYTVDSGGKADESGYSKGIYNGGQSYGDAHSGNGEITSGIIYGSESPNSNYQSRPNYDSEYTVDSGGKTDESEYSKGIYNGGQSYDDAHSGNGEITSGFGRHGESSKSNLKNVPNYSSSDMTSESSIRDGSSKSTYHSVPNYGIRHLDNEGMKSGRGSSKSSYEDLSYYSNEHPGRGGIFSGRGFEHKSSRSNGHSGSGSVTSESLKSNFNGQSLDNGHSGDKDITNQSVFRGGSTKKSYQLYDSRHLDTGETTSGLGSSKSRYHDSQTYGIAHVGTKVTPSESSFGSRSSKSSNQSNQHYGSGNSGFPRMKSRGELLKSSYQDTQSHDNEPPVNGGMITVSDFGRGSTNSYTSIPNYGSIHPGSGRKASRGRSSKHMTIYRGGHSGVGGLTSRRDSGGGTSESSYKSGNVYSDNYASSGGNQNSNRYSRRATQNNRYLSNVNNRHTYIGGSVIPNQLDKTKESDGDHSTISSGQHLSNDSKVGDELTVNEPHLNKESGIEHSFSGDVLKTDLQESATTSEGVSDGLMSRGLQDTFEDKRTDALLVSNHNDEPDSNRAARTGKSETSIEDSVDNT